MLLPGHKPCLPRKDSSCASNVNFSKTPTIVHSSSKIGLSSFRLPTRRTSPSRTTILVLNYLVTMSFRFNVDLSFNFPPPPPRSPTRISSAPDQDPDGGPQKIKRGFAGWLQTARRHPRYSLRLLYFITALAGLIIYNVVLSNLGYYYYYIVDLHRSALGPVSALPRSLLPTCFSSHYR